MSSKQKRIADFLFGVQLVCAVVLCGSFFFRILQTVQGVSLSMLLGVEAFFVLNFLLALRARAAQPSRVTTQAVAAYAAWIVLAGSDVVAIFLNGGYRWSLNDTLTSLIVVVGGAATISYASIRQLPISGPGIRGSLSVAAKALPQFFLAAKIIGEGGAGIPAASIISGHITGLVRLGQMLVALREGRTDRNRFWLVVTEIANEASWVAVTIAWLLWLMT